MKTAMTEFSEWLKAYEYELPLELQIKAKECLELEKEQIIEAAKSCNYIGGATSIEAEEYYNQTYNQNKYKLNFKYGVGVENLDIDIQNIGQK